MLLVATGIIEGFCILRVNNTFGYVIVSQQQTPSIIPVVQYIIILLKYPQLVPIFSPGVPVSNTVAMYFSPKRQYRECVVDSGNVRTSMSISGKE